MSSSNKKHMLLRILCLSLTGASLLSCLASCNTGDQGGVTSYEETDAEQTEADGTEAETTAEETTAEETTSEETTEEVTTAAESDTTPEPEPEPLPEIVYEMSKATQTEGAGATLSMLMSYKTGELVSAFVTPSANLFKEDVNYYIVDWGDGTWSYRGPYNYKTGGAVYHTYKKAGTYQVKGCAVNVAGSGTVSNWTAPTTIEVTGDDYTGNMINAVTPVGSNYANDKTPYENIIDGDNTTKWQSKKSRFADSKDYVGLLFNDYYTLDTLEVKLPSDLDAFPDNISIEYTTDGGETWYMYPHYYYVLPNNEGYYSCHMNFPNPKGATLVLPLEGIVANGIRFRSVTYRNSDKYFGVEEMRVYGEKGSYFYTSYDGYYGADLSNMWTMLGLATTETNLGGNFRMGIKQMGSVEWLAWDGIQHNWSGDAEALEKHVGWLKSAVYGGDGWYYDSKTGKYVVDESEYQNNPRNDGFIWAVSGAPQHLDKQNHYTNNSSLIIASRDYLLTGNNTDDFLSSVNAKGQVMLDKLRKAMEYMLEDLNGKSGLMTIYDPRNDGTVKGLASNYWDSLNCYGYNSSYENIFFYQAVLAMADIEEYLGNTADAENYRNIAKKVKEVFNETFWDENKGRYITSININGDVLDFGITHLNCHAVAVGLASEEQAQLIYDWLDGKRIIEGDDSTGEDIYAFKVAPRSNTYGIENVVGEDGLHYWWYNEYFWFHHGFKEGETFYNDVHEGLWGEYGNQMQNGGTIFYISHYDVSGRTVLSADLAMDRFNVIMEEFHKDSLRRDPRTKWGYYLVSILGEFPESGLVPATFVTDIIGITPEVAGLKIDACLPSDMTYAGIMEYHFADRVYQIEVNKDLTEAEMTLDGDKYIVKVPADKIYYITMDNRLIDEEEAKENKVGAPTIAEPEVQIDCDATVSDTEITVAYNNSKFKDLTYNGKSVDKANYTAKKMSVLFKKEFLNTLPTGKNVFTFTTTGGSVDITIDVKREGIFFGDADRIKKYSEADVVFDMSFGAVGVGKVKVNGKTLADSDYEYSEGKFYVKNSYLSTLKKGVYELLIYDNNGKYEDCVITVGYEPDDIFVLNFDSFKADISATSTSNTAGWNGNGAGVVCDSNTTLFSIGQNSEPSYNFEVGKTYKISMYLKFDYTVSGSSSLQDLLMPIYFLQPGLPYNGDIIYLRYNDEQGYYANYSKEKLIKEGDWYKLETTFMYKKGYTDLAFNVWMKTSFVLDSLVITPVS